MSKLTRIASVTLFLATFAQAQAAWVATGKTAIADIPKLNGQRVRTLTLQAQAIYEEHDVRNNRVVGKRWLPLKGAKVQFRAHASTGAFLPPLATTGSDGWAKTSYEVPRYQRPKVLPFYAWVMPHRFPNGLLSKASPAKRGVIYVN